MSKSLFSKLHEYYEKKWWGALWWETLKILEQHGEIIFQKPLRMHVSESNALAKKLFIILKWENDSLTLSIDENDKVEIE